MSIETVTAILSDSLTDEGIEEWLRTPNRFLDNRRPNDILLAGSPKERESVIEAARKFVSEIAI